MGSLALSHGRSHMNTKASHAVLQRALVLSSRLHTKPKKVKLEKLLISAVGKESQLASLQGCEAGANYHSRVRD